MNPLLKQVFDVGRQIFTLGQRLQKAEEQIKELQATTREMGEKIDILVGELRRQRDNAAYQQEIAARDRENLILRLQLAMAQAGKELPAMPPQSPIGEAKSERD